MRYRCVKCHSPFSLPAKGAGTIACMQCSFAYRYEQNYLKYEFDSIMFEAYKENYLLNKVLITDAYLSYIFLQDGSLSLNGRDDVKNFRNYIQSYISSGVLLDIGCGILSLPGYLDFEDKSKFEFYGLDPIDDKAFSGKRVVGCAEYMPFDDQQFDAVVFATSLDHVCSLGKTIAESHRILAFGGMALIWMSDRSVSPFSDKPLCKRIRSHFRQKLANPRDPLLWRTFKIYLNWMVLYVPHGAVDPFHSFNENPTEIIPLMRRQGFQLQDESYNSANEAFLCFRKLN